MCRFRIRSSGSSLWGPIGTTSRACAGPSGPGWRRSSYGWGTSPTAAGWDAALAAEVAAHAPDLVVTAGFMKLVGPAFLVRFAGRVVNTHPALLPSFPGTHGVRDALAYGVRVTGATVHLVDTGVDTGPIIAQAAVEVLPGDDEATLHERIKEVERDLLVRTVGRMVRSGYRVEGRRVHL